MKYADQLKHPFWQRKRLERLQAADWKCVECGCEDSQLHVHHERYIVGRMAWDYPDDLLAVLCEDCHGERHGKSPDHAPRAPARRWCLVSKDAANLLDRAVWLVVQRSELWSALDGESRDLLTGQSEPYGLFFSCIERCIHQHGPLAASALLDEMRSQTGDGVALARIAAFHDLGKEADIANELDTVLDLLRLQSVEEELRVLFESGSVPSPEAQARGRSLLSMQKRLVHRRELRRAGVVIA